MSVPPQRQLKTERPPYSRRRLSGPETKLYRFRMQALFLLFPNGSLASQEFALHFFFPSRSVLYPKSALALKERCYNQQVCRMGTEMLDSESKIVQIVRI